MTQYEKIMKEMTVESFAGFLIDEVSGFCVTHDGHIYIDWDDAIKAEIDYLNSEATE